MNYYRKAMYGFLTCFILETCLFGLSMGEVIFNHNASCALSAAITVTIAIACIPTILWYQRQAAQ